MGTRVYIIRAGSTRNVCPWTGISQVSFLVYKPGNVKKVPHAPFALCNVRLSLPLTSCHPSAVGYKAPRTSTPGMESISRHMVSKLITGFYKNLSDRAMVFNHLCVHGPFGDLAKCTVLGHSSREQASFILGWGPRNLHFRLTPV